MRAPFLLMITVLVAVVSSVRAQPPGFTFGIKAGLNYSTWSTKLSEKGGQTGKVDYQVGVFARAGEKWYFQPEINLTALVSDYTLGYLFCQPRFRQLNVPLMVGYHLVRAQKMNWRISLGSVMSCQLRKPEVPAGIAYQKINAGGVVNAGVDLGNLTLDFRYSRAFTNMTAGLNERTSILNLSVGYKFF